MRHFHNILYVSRGVDDETDGLKQALSLARNNNAELKALLIAPELPKDMKDYEAKYKASMIDDMREAILKTADSIKLSEADVKFEIELEADKTPATRIIQHVLQNDHDLIIKETETRGKKTGLKAIDMDLLRKCPCPVWLCRPIEQSRKDIKVAVAIDPKTEEAAAIALSRRMLELAQSLAEDCSGELHILSCWDYEFEEYLRHNPWVKTNESEIQEAVYHTERSHKTALDGLINEAGIREKVNKTHHIRGEADEKIPAFIIDHKIDILVMGTVARTGIPGFIIGNTAENIIQKVPCSLMALKPKGFISPVKAY